MHLQILLGRQRGRTLPLEAGTYVFGRSDDADVVLASELVSRHHASIVVEGGSVRVTDLESSNGTFVNGCRVLGDGIAKEGDVLLLGDFAMRLHRAEVPALSPERALGPGVASGLSGNLLEVPPATLLRYVAILKKTVRVELTSPPLRSTITFARGHVAEVVVDTRKSRDPIQALTALLRWKGTFEVTPAIDAPTSLLLGLDAVLAPIGSAARPSTAPRR